MPTTPDATTKPKRKEHEYPDADVRRGLQRMRAQLLAAGVCDSAYKVAKDMEWPQMEKTVRPPPTCRVRRPRASPWLCSPPLTARAPAPQLKAACAEMTALEGDDARRAYADAWTRKPKGGHRAAADFQTFDENETAVLVAAADLTIPKLTDLMQSILCKESAERGERISITPELVRKWRRKHCRSMLKSAGLDIARAQKANPAVRDTRLVTAHSTCVESRSLDAITPGSRV